MSQSRSSFDLSGAIATAASLSGAPRSSRGALPRRRAGLVRAHGVGAADAAPSADRGRRDRAFNRPRRGRRGAPAADAAADPPTRRGVRSGRGGCRRPALASRGGARSRRRGAPAAEAAGSHGREQPLVRCERIVDWIVEAVGASEVFLADATGLPIAGAAEPEARLAAAGVVASSVAHLAAASRATARRSSSCTSATVRSSSSSASRSHRRATSSASTGRRRSASARRTRSASPAATRSASRGAPAGLGSSRLRGAAVPLAQPEIEP